MLLVVFAPLVVLALLVVLAPLVVLALLVVLVPQSGQSAGVLSTASSSVPI